MLSRRGLLQTFLAAPLARIIPLKKFKINTVAAYVEPLTLEQASTLLAEQAAKSINKQMYDYWVNRPDAYRDENGWIY